MYMQCIEIMNNVEGIQQAYMRRKEERRKQGQTNNKAKQRSTPKADTFPTSGGTRTHDTLHSRQSALYMYIQWTGHLGGLGRSPE